MQRIFQITMWQFCEMALSSSQETMLTNWVTAGGILIAMRPDAQLATLLGITPNNTTLSNKYLLVNVTSEQGNGIVNQTIQYHMGPPIYIHLTVRQNLPRFILMQ